MNAVLQYDAALALDFVDLVLILLAIEAILIALWANTRSSSIPGALFSLAAGGALVMTLRVALVQAPLAEIGLWLAVAVVCHLIALKRSASAQRVVELEDLGERAQGH